MIYVVKGTLKVCFHNQVDKDDAKEKIELFHTGDYIDHIWKEHGDYENYRIKYIEAVGDQSVGVGRREKKARPILARKKTKMLRLARESQDRGAKVDS